VEQYEAILETDLIALRQLASRAEAYAADNAELRLQNEALQEDLYCACEAYDALDRIHNEVCAETNELSEENAILKQDLNDTTEELDAALAELDIALDALTEAGLLPQTEADDLKQKFN